MVLLQCLHLIEEILVGDGLFVADVVRQLQIVEEAFGACDLAGFHGAQFQRAHVAFGFCDKEDVLQTTVLTEGDRPVGRVVADRRGDLEAARQLGVDRDFGSGFEPSGELRLHTLPGISVGEHPVLHAFADPDGVGLVAPARVDEDGGIVFALDPVVADVVHDHRGLLLDDQTADLGDELLRVVPEHAELVRSDTLEDPRGATPGDGRGLGDLAEQVVFDAVGRVDVEVARVAAVRLALEVLAHGQIRTGRLPALDALGDGVRELGHHELGINLPDRVPDQFVVVEVHGVRVLVVDALPELLELLLLEIGVQVVAADLPFERVADDHAGDVLQHRLQDDLDSRDLGLQRCGQCGHEFPVQPLFGELIGELASLVDQIVLAEPQVYGVGFLQRERDRIDALVLNRTPIVGLKKFRFDDRRCGFSYV